MQQSGEKAQSAGSERSKSFFPEVESLRGIAALCVLIYHVVGHRVVVVFGAPQQPKGIFDPLNFDAILSALVTTLFNGDAAVELFFVMSGFVLAISLSDRPALTPRSYLQFDVRRIFRIMPGVWVSLILSIAILIYYRSAPPLWVQVNSFWLGDGILGINAPLWSIRVEMAISAVFPMLYMMNRIGGPLISLILALVLGVLAYKSILPDIFIYTLAFQLGIMLPAFGEPLVRRTPTLLSPWAAAASVVLLLASLNLQRLGVLSGAAWVVIKPLAAFHVLAYVVYGSPILRSYLTVPRVRFFGKISFGIYLLHAPVMLFTLLLFLIYVPASFTSQTVAFGATMLIFILPLTIVFAWLSYEFVERPFIRWGHKISAWLERPSRPQLV